MAPKISKEDHARFVEEFKFYDKDGNGSIPIDKVADVLKALKEYPPTFEELESLDPHQKRTVEFEKFLELMAARVPEDDEAMLITAFAVFDKDNDGLISAEELRKALSSMGMMTNEEAAELIKKADPNGDGAIDYKYFVKKIMK
ncbi:hypothetical protein ACHQM5_005323 [Ranunculus cassubicifolius]